jgi:hypothetical protein
VPVCVACVCVCVCACVCLCVCECVCAGVCADLILRHVASILVFILHDASVLTLLCMCVAGKARTLAEFAQLLNDTGK